MRVPLIFASGHLLDGVPAGSGADEALAHACRSLRQFAIAVDGVEEAFAALVEASRVETALSYEASKKVGPGEGFPLPADFGLRPRYWQERQLFHAKAGVIALDQIREALLHVESVTKSDAALDARHQLLAAFPDLNGLRDSVAHASSRARWMTDARNRPPISLALTADETANGILWSDFVSSVGHVDGTTFTFRVVRNGHPAAGRLELTDGNITLAAELIQQLVDALPWKPIAPNVGPVRLRLG